MERLMKLMVQKNMARVRSETSRSATHVEYESVTFDLFDKFLYVLLFPRILIYSKDYALPKWWDNGFI